MTLLSALCAFFHRDRTWDSMLHVFIDRVCLSVRRDVPVGVPLDLSNGVARVTEV